MRNLSIPAFHLLAGLILYVLKLIIKLFVLVCQITLEDLQIVVLNVQSILIVHQI